MSKLSNVKGRIDYITSAARQENLYAVYNTTDKKYWSLLAKENQQDFIRSGTTGTCIEARELIIALPEIYTKFEPKQVLEEFTDFFKNTFNVECISALHHNKAKTNYHIHLIFSERRLLDEPEQKIATRSVFFNEEGKRVRTKKEISDNNGNIRKGCTIIPKGEIYEEHYFSKKDTQFKSDYFLDDIKEKYTNLINIHIENPDKQLKVFNPNSVYLPTKKIGKNNPKADEIKKDNEARTDWNRTADVALVNGIDKVDIIKIKNEEIYGKAKKSYKEYGEKPNLFRNIIQKAKELLLNLIKKKEMPQKPICSINSKEYGYMQIIMDNLRKTASEIKSLRDIEIPNLKQQYESKRSPFKKKEKAALESKIQENEEKVKMLENHLTEIVTQAGYNSVEDFISKYKKSTQAVNQYNRELDQYNRDMSVYNYRKLYEEMNKKRKNRKPLKSRDPFELDSR